MTTAVLALAAIIVLLAASNLILAVVLYRAIRRELIAIVLEAERNARASRLALAGLIRALKIGGVIPESTPEPKDGDGG